MHACTGRPELTHPTLSSMCTEIFSVRDSNFVHVLSMIWENVLREKELFPETPIDDAAQQKICNIKQK